MFAFVAWFAHEPRPPTALQAWQRRAQEYLDAHTPETWHRQLWTGDGWGIAARHVSMPDWRWSFADSRDGIHVVSAGFPLGLEPTTPVPLGKRLLEGEDIHADVAAPFALLAVDARAGRFSVQQDWHGMGQIFHYSSESGTALSNLPTALPTTLGDTVRPNLKGWGYYLASDAFVGDSSPARGVRLLGPGERLLGSRRGKTWQVSSEVRRQIDDIIVEAQATPASLEAIADSVHEGVARSVRSLAHYWPHGLTMGLSGGRDSRMLAAVMLSEGLVPDFVTNEENPLEGEIARDLARILRERRGLRFEHEFYVATEEDRVLEHSVVERAQALQHRNDYMFRANYLKRPPEPPMPDTFAGPSILGIYGEYISGYWSPPSWQEDISVATHEQARKVLGRRLNTGAPWRSLGPAARQRMEAFIADLAHRADALDLDPVATIIYCYALGRIRRTPTALTHVEQTMPMGVPEIVRASVQLSARDAVSHGVHSMLTERLVPEWTDVPFVKAGTGVDPADRLRIWHGTGAQELEDMLAADRGPITAMMRQPAVEQALRRARQGVAGGPEDRTLRQFAMGAVAERAMHDGTAGAADGPVAKITDLLRSKSPFNRR